MREGRSFKGRGVLVLIKRKRGWGGREGGAAQFVRGNYKSFKGINLTVLERMHQFIMGEAVGGTGGATQSVRGNYISVKGINVPVLERMHQFIVYIL